MMTSTRNLIVTSALRQANTGSSLVNGPDLSRLRGEWRHHRPIGRIKRTAQDYEALLWGPTPTHGKIQKSSRLPKIENSVFTILPSSDKVNHQTSVPTMLSVLAFVF